MCDILLVEDSGPMRRLFRAQFEESDLIMLEAATVKEGVDLIRSLIRPPLYVVLDFWLSGIEGLDALRVFRNLLPKATIMVYTGNNNKYEEIEALNNGADGWFVKGQDNGQLKLSIQAAFLRRSNRNEKQEVMANG